MGWRSVAQGALVAALVIACGESDAAQAPPSAGGAAATPAARTGQRISLDLKGVDILDVLKLLSQKSGLNFVAGRNVSGRVTIFVSDVDVWEAFELIIGANDLAYEQHGTIITVMMARDYELMFGQKFQERTSSEVIALRYAKVVQVATVLNQVKSSVGRVVADEATNTLVLGDVDGRLQEMKEIVAKLDRPTASRVYSLNYADAEKLKEKVQEALSPVGTFTFDARTNKVIISDLAENLRKTDQIIEAFDTPDGEVLIEAKIVTVLLTDDFTFGIDWQRVFAGLDAQVRNNFDSLSGDVFATTSPATGVALKILGSTTKSNARIVLEALQEITKTETLASPRIMVANNQEARILVGTKEAFITVTTTVPATGSTVNAPQVQFVDVGTKLFVTPNVKRDGRIQLKIRPEVSTTADTVTTSDGNRIPIVSTTEAETTVLVQSGSTVIIGGLIDTKVTNATNQIPILGNLPLIGRAFKGTVDTKRKSETVLFLTPQIISPDGAQQAVTPEVKQFTATLPDVTVPTVTLQDPVPASYQQQVRQRLQHCLAGQFRELSLPKGSVVVSFILSHDGMITGEQQVTSPQGDSFVKAAEQALVAAQPFPVFPEGAQATEVRFRLAVEYAP